MVGRRHLLGLPGLLAVPAAARAQAGWPMRPVSVVVLWVAGGGADTVTRIFVRTGFMQIAAEELNVPLGRVRVVEGDTALTPDQGVTYGSLSIQNGGCRRPRTASAPRPRR